MNRSQLLREALAEKLKGMGIALPTDIVDAPMRLTVMDQPATQPVPESKPTKYPARNVRTKPPIKPKKKGS